MLNQLITKTLPYVPKPLVYMVAKRYVASETLTGAVGVVKELNSKNILATMDFLGEFVSDRTQADQRTEVAKNSVQAAFDHNLNSGVSVKLTSLGLDIDDEYCYTNLRSIVELAKKLNRFVRIDMENTPYTARTLSLYRRLRADGYENVGVAIQAYLKRSEADLIALAPFKPFVRLCKGIYVEPEAVAFKDRVEIQNNYKRLLQILFENDLYPAIATHDDVLIDFAREYAQKHSIPRDRFEFQMLLGVREGKRDELVKEGYRVRVYVPFGDDWYGYSIRRLKENPEIAGHVFRAMLFRE